MYPSETQYDTELDNFVDIKKIFLEIIVSYDYFLILILKYAQM